MPSDREPALVAVEEAQPRLEDPVGNSKGLGDERDGLSAQIVEASLEVGCKATDASRGVIGLARLIGLLQAC